ncbi:MAG: hypothetical protein K2W95_09155 [Candidatus Obscuribacterales bacterium]|nr:hypothetical protein [Candidatus Obscuribacterales bacterium]
MNLADGAKGPSIAELQRFIRDRKRIEFVLITGDKVYGTLRWFDDAAFCLTTGGDQSFTILRPAVVAYRAMGGSPAPAAPTKASDAAVQSEPASAGAEKSAGLNDLLS